jgi:hypothetical protein
MPFHNKLERQAFPAQSNVTNIRLGWIGLPGTNALAYYEKA